MAPTQDSGFLTDKDIIDKREKLICEFDQKLAEGASYDLCLGGEVYISGEEYPRVLTDTGKDSFVTIPRGQFGLLLTKEYVKIPKDHLAFISIKFDKKAQGLINISGFHVDPGFEGRIIFSIFNSGPNDVVLKYGEPMFIIFFFKLHEKVLRPYKGDKKGQKSLPTKWVTSLKGTSASLSDVDKRVSRLETIAWILLALLGGLIGVITTIISL